MDGRIFAVREKLEALEEQLRSLVEVRGTQAWQGGNVFPNKGLNPDEYKALQTLGDPLVGKCLSTLDAARGSIQEYRDGMYRAHRLVQECLKLMTSYHNSDPLMGRDKLIADWLANGRKPESASEVARFFHISRTTLYKIIRRLEKKNAAPGMSSG